MGAYGKNADGYIKINIAKDDVLSTGDYEHNLNCQSHTRCIAFDRQISKTLSGK